MSAWYNLLLFCATSAGASPPPAPGLDPQQADTVLPKAKSAQSILMPVLDFRGGKLTGWSGQGFYPTTATGRGPALKWGVCSSETDSQPLAKPSEPNRTDVGGTPQTAASHNASFVLMEPKSGLAGSTASTKLNAHGSKNLTRPDASGSSALLHKTFVVPPGVTFLECQAFAVLPKGLQSEAELDVVVFTSGKRIIPKEVRTETGWKRVPHLLPPEKKKPRVYRWSIGAYAGHTLGIALIDGDGRPGCHVFCSGFCLVADEMDAEREFSRFMLRLQREHRLAPMTRYDSKHFLAISNAEEKFTEQRLRDCELMYVLFFDHFRRKGFRIHEPAGKLMFAVFDSQSGFEAYVGREVPSLITGLYHLPTNRLVVYDFATNRSFVAQRQLVHIQSRAISSELEKSRFLGSIDHQAQESRSNANIATIMHEVAHQLSFNCGLLNREGDVPAWLAEGMACYCEPTTNHAWQGIGELNPDRIDILVQAVRRGKALYPLRELITSDNWAKKGATHEEMLTGYAQSWALFRMLMEERPAAMRKYLTHIHPRATPDHRLADFAEAFGTDLPRLQTRYGDYIKTLVEQHSRLPR